MRDAVDLAAASRARERGRRGHTSRWATFVPRTNVVWLTYLLRVLLRRVGNSLLPGSSETSLDVQRDLRERLEATLDVIGVEELGRVPESAGTLISLAVEKGWLSGEDVEEWKARV